MAEHDPALPPVPISPNDDAHKPVALARALRGAGPQWGMQSEDLNATLLAWPPGHAVAAHRNSERDVLVIVLDGTATVRVDGVEHEMAADELLLLPRGSERAFSVGPAGVRYLSIHLRRGPLLPTPRPPA